MLHSEFMDTGFYIMFYPIVFFYGICIGSFLNVVIYRLPRNESLIKRSSHCTTCGAKIRVIDIIPILSWLMLRGKCRSCGEKISPRYPIVEALNGIIYVVTFTVMDFNLKSLLCCFCFSILICIGFIDWDTLEMDPVMIGMIAALGLPLCVISALPAETQASLPEFVQLEGDSLLSHLIGLVCVSVPFFLIGEVTGLIARKVYKKDLRRGIELGDTLLMGAAGLLLGWKAVLASAFFGILIAAGWGLIGKLISGESKFAFGPALSIGLFFGALWGEPLLNWYIGILTYNPYA